MDDLLELRRQCPRCKARVKNLASHKYSKHSAKGKARRETYENSEKARARKILYLDRKLRREAAAKAAAEPPPGDRG